MSASKRSLEIFALVSVWGVNIDLVDQVNMLMPDVELVGDS